jgi:hypothetical protein
VTTRAGQRIGAGDRVATRRNDSDLGVANRDTWTVTAVGRHGELVVTPAGAAGGDVTPTGVNPARSGQRVLPANYVTAHVELAYASTAHGVQGDTVPAAHLVLGEHTGAASAYVGMTRGRTTNTAHLIAPNLAEAREQWIAAFGRDRADGGPPTPPNSPPGRPPATPNRAHLKKYSRSCTRRGRPSNAAWTGSPSQSRYATVSARSSRSTPATPTDSRQVRPSTGIRL